MIHPAHRQSIALEPAQILSHAAGPDQQYILTLHTPRCAEKALPGSFVHLTVSDSVPMRRPLSIMRTHAEEGWIELLYKVVGKGTEELSRRKPGEYLSVLGPIGQPFILHESRPAPLLIGGGVGIPPMIFIADSIQKQHRQHKPVVLLGSESPFPLETRVSEKALTGIPDHVNHGLTLIEKMGFVSRLASLQSFEGCLQGYVTELAEFWLNSLDEAALNQVEIFSCGPHPMLEAVARLAEKYHLPCQVSLEEYMACAVGGCAGCVVEVKTDEGPAMKRVCVDGPVFEASQVF
ncbi:MAG: dihydroorotate dehydrogenase electron transfer subunit [Gammaproteobacteria bacterium]|nr:MAG: dihydroorotate dehydrogenase electron transfer subunit [Gammaproteobacteria bacterium]